MQKRPHDPQDLTHLGWQRQVQGAGDEQDHLLITEPSTPQPTEPEALVEFLNAALPQPTSSSKQDHSAANFLEVQDFGLESQPYQWGGKQDNETITDEMSLQVELPPNAVVIFGSDQDTLDNPTSNISLFS